MKRIIGVIPVAVILLFTGTQMYGQCVPDVENCKDTLDPGEICPRQLPDATVNVEYDEVITVISPDTVVSGEFTVSIDFIVVDSVTNLPEGITYEANADKFYADSIYCIQISGTPVEAGEYNLAIYVTPFVFLIPGQPSVPVPVPPNDTSIVMIVNETAGVDPTQSYYFRVLQNIPNPFSDITRIGFFTPWDDRIQLEVYNILGELMHSEKQGVPPGEHYFEFDGRTLLPGTYFYRVSNYKEIHTGKFIKARR